MQTTVPSRFVVRPELFVDFFFFVPVKQTDRQPHGNKTGIFFLKTVSDRMFLLGYHPLSWPHFFFIVAAAGKEGCGRGEGGTRRLPTKGHSYCRSLWLPNMF